MQHPIRSQMREISEQALRRRGELGTFLIILGSLLLIDMLSKESIVGLLILPAIGLLSMSWGVITKETSLIIPGGISSGLGWGVLLAQKAFGTTAGNVQGGVIVLGLAAGFLIIIPLSQLIQRAHPWPVIPGGILGVLAILLLLGQSARPLLDMIGTWWPIAIIILGGVLLWQMVANKRQ